MKLIYKDFTKNLIYYLYAVLKGDLFKDDDLYYFILIAWYMRDKCG